MRNSYEERAKKFIAVLFPFITDCEDEFDYQNAVEEFNQAYNRKVICNNGAVRVAFISSDYVVKLEYNKYGVNRYGGCEKECKMYAIAEAEGFAYMFAKVTRFNYNGMTFYIMPRIYGIDKYPYRYAPNFMTLEEVNFCKRYDIRDLHSCNYGFRNRHVCLIDYASCMWYD